MKPSSTSSDGIAFQVPSRLDDLEGAVADWVARAHQVARYVYVKLGHVTLCRVMLRCIMWACGQTPLTKFDRKGDRLIRTPMHTRCIPRFVPDAYPMYTPTHAAMQ